MNTSVRLREERERLGYSQSAFAELVGASKHAQINWEKGTTFPNASALETWHSAGVDVLFVLTGRRAPLEVESLAEDEARLIRDFRVCASAAQAFLLQGASLLAESPRKSPRDS